jgi:hypothetical protein
MIELVESQTGNSDKLGVVVDNFLVPNIEALKNQDGLISFTLDHRYGTKPMTLEEAEDFIWFVANSMAVAAGFSSFGENSKPVNPFQNQYRVVVSSESFERK